MRLKPKRRASWYVEGRQEGRVVQLEKYIVIKPPAQRKREVNEITNPNQEGVFN